MEVTAAEFDQLVEDALDRVPSQLTDLLDNVVVLVQDAAPADDPHLLGLYDGHALTDRDSRYTFVTPDRILLFRQPLLAMCQTLEQLAHEVEVTVVHEIAHHFGIDDARLHAWGWG